MYTRIVVPLDGSNLAERALPPAEELARLYGATSHLIGVVDLARLPVGFVADPIGAVRQSVNAEQLATIGYLECVATRLSARGLVVTTAVPHGVPAQEIVAATRPGDLVVMATHGRGGLSRWFLGSVAEEVVRHASVPVMLIRANVPVAEAVPARDAAPGSARLTGRAAVI